MKNPWERHFIVSPTVHESKYARLTIEMGLSGWLLVLYIGDERVALATQMWVAPALELAAVIHEGIEQMKKVKP